MSVGSNYEQSINSVYGLSDNIVALGSFERDGGIPYVYNNQMSGIVLQDLNTDLEPTDNNNIFKDRNTKYKNIDLNVPVLSNQIKYQILEDACKNNHSRTSIAYVMEYYKQIIYLSDSRDDYGMLLYGFRYSQSNNSKGTDVFDFDTIGIRGKFGLNNNQYGITLWGEALIYGQDSNGNTTIDSVSGSKTTEYFFPYDYSINNLTVMCTTEMELDSKGNETGKLLVNFKDVDGNIDLSLLIDTSGATDAKDEYTSDKIDSVITMPTYSESIDYTYYHIKTFSDKLTMDELEKQTHILVTKQGVKYV